MIFLMPIKLRLNFLMRKILISLKKIRFLKSKNNSLLERNNILTQEIESLKSSSSVNEIAHPWTEVLNEILDRSKTYGDKRGLG